MNYYWQTRFEHDDNDDLNKLAEHLNEVQADNVKV